MSAPRTGDRMSRAALAKAVRPTERAVHVAILRWLRANVSALTWHIRNEGFRAGKGHIFDNAQGVISGISDLGGVVEYGLPGRYFAIEVKRPGWRTSDVDPRRLANQLRFGRMVEERGGLFLMASSVDEVEAWATAHGIVRPKGWRSPWAGERAEGEL